MSLKVYNRTTREIYLEEEFGQKEIEFMYNNFFGRILLRLFISRKFFSKLLAFPKHRASSVKDIPNFVKENNINMDEYEEKTYTSFNDFFTRKVKSEMRPIAKEPDQLISVADSKLSVYDINEDSNLNIKGIDYKLHELVNDVALADEFNGGKCLIFRLCVDDYHRFAYIDDGEMLDYKVINGSLHTVRDAAKKFRIYAKNQREYQVLNTKNFGKVVQIDVGAILVGRIKNYCNKTFKRGEEKGYFYYGGSTVVVLLKKDCAIIDEDIEEYSKQGIETKVKYGEKIGIRVK